LFSLEWHPRAQPLRPAAALFPRVGVACALERFCEFPLEGLVTATHLVVVGAEETLPWTRGAGYFGRLQAIPELLVPTAWEASLPDDLLLALVKRKAQRSSEATLHGPPWLIAPDLSGGIVPRSTSRVISLAATSIIAPARLGAWCTDSPGVNHA
jgi:hypothetical protein